MGSKKGIASKTLNNAGQAELDLLRDELNNILGRVEIVKQIVKALLSKTARIYGD